MIIGMLIVVAGMGVTAFCLFFYLVSRLDGHIKRIEKLESTVETLSRVLDMRSYGGFSRRLDVLTYEVNLANKRIDDLPSEKARAVQAKIDELEKMVEELK